MGEIMRFFTKVISVVFLFFIIFNCQADSSHRINVETLNSGGISARSHALPENSIDFMHTTLTPNHVKGGRIYDNFIVELDAMITVENNLLQFANPIDPAMVAPTIPEGWSCSHCHGFGYKGGIYTFGNGVTPNLVESLNKRKITEEDIYNLLIYGINVFDGTAHVNTHNYDGILSIQAIVDVADFIVNEIFDPDQYLRTGTNESVINHMPSMFIYKGAADLVKDPDPLAVRVNGIIFTCTECHGVAGRQVPNFDLYDLAWKDPYKWMHRTNFGTPRSQMLVPGIFSEGPSIHPGVYEVMLVKDLKFGNSRNTAHLLEYVQTHFAPEPIVPAPVL